MGRTAAHDHYQTLRKRILGGEIGVDTRLYESTLTGELGTSRTPIREALAMLEQDGIVEREPRGYRVRRRSTQEVLDYFDIRTALESAAAASAAIRATELERAQMIEILRRAGESEPVAAAHLHRDWHKALIASSHNEALGEFVERAEVMILLHEKPWPVSIAGTAQSQREHLQILDAVLARDAIAAQSLMSEHMARARDYQLQSLVDRH
ncbi:GntR family transcriptional regulator [Plantibacter sp. Mn2098]|uniref:GntR family transcriptional regulator n=1 Tax=Plantibacter sp. Mn2098 TaxID=3395266 RepID=UPI003BD77563